MAVNLPPDVFAGWYQIQESLSRLTGFELALYGGDGRPVGMVSGESPFCRAFRRGGAACARCPDECGAFIAAACPGGEAQSFTCSFGQVVFAVALGEGAEGLVVAGGKTFAGREQYAAALARLLESGAKVSHSGKHKYRYMGKRRQKEALALVRSAAAQYFQASGRKARRRLMHSRHAALLEGASLLMLEDDLAEMAEKILRGVNTMFEAQTTSLWLLHDGPGADEAHFSYGVHKDAPDEAGLAVARKALSVRGGTGRPVVVKAGGPHGVKLPPGVGSAVGLAFNVGGHARGAVVLLGAELGPDDAVALRRHMQQSAALLENLRLRGQVKRKMDEARALMRACRQFGSEADRDGILRRMFERSAGFVEAERASLMLLDEGTDELAVALSMGLGEEAAASRLGPGEGIAGKVASAGAPVMVRDARSGAGLRGSGRPDYKTGSFISLPIKVDGRVIGVMNLADKASGGPFDEDDLEFAAGLVSQATMAMERGMYSEGLGRLRAISMTDHATGLLSRRYFNERLQEETDRAKRYGHGLALALVEVGGLKRYIDSHGRKKGDEALKKLGGLMASALRSADILARYGEDSFALIFPETPPEKAGGLVGRLRKRLAKTAPGETGTGLNIRIGLSSFPEDGDRPAGLLEKAFRELRP